MLVAKLPGSTYATAATNAGPSSATSPRSRPRDRSCSSVDSGSASSGGPTAVARAGAPPAGVTGEAGTSAHRRPEAERLWCAGVRRGLVQALVELPELGHQRPAATPGRLLLGD